MRDIFIYALIDPITENIRYVGKTVGLYKRYIQHIKKVENAKRRKERWINSLLQKDINPILVVLQRVGYNENWELCERKWIKFCRKEGYDLTNHTDGDNTDILEDK